jgi:hypothetical protein
MALCSPALRSHIDIDVFITGGDSVSVKNVIFSVIYTRELTNKTYLISSNSKSVSCHVVNEI